jgi:MarR-like DNA-binding transcriptional regulator SgrR of sgrS sRNA
MNRSSTPSLRISAALRSAASLLPRDGTCTHQDETAPLRLSVSLKPGPAPALRALISSSCAALTPPKATQPGGAEVSGTGAGAAG